MEIPNDAYNMSDAPITDDEPLRFHNFFAPIERLQENLKSLIAQRDAALAKAHVLSSECTRLTSAVAIWQAEVTRLDARNKQLERDLEQARLALGSSPVPAG